MDQHSLLATPDRAADENSHDLPPPPDKRSGDSVQAEKGVERYEGPWDADAAAHLLRRTMFGLRHEHWQEALTTGMDATIDKLLADRALPNPPLNTNPNEPNVALGATWVNTAPLPGMETQRRQGYKAWWFANIVGQSLSLREKMTLFWHNHFVIQDEVVNDSRISYRYLTMLRSNALGNLRTLAEQITVDPAMLIYLNGNQNNAFAPNENYARELFELFTIGKGQQIGPGNYTNYTEDDIIEAAKVLTGWLVFPRQQNIDPQFLEVLHSPDSKQFSAAFNNEMIQNSGAEEYKSLIAMIFRQEETSRFFCRNLYRWFVNHDIDDSVESRVIEPLAATLRDNNYEVKPVMRQLLASAHFYESSVRGAVIKNPVDFLAGLFRQFDIDLRHEQLNEEYTNFLTYGFGLSLLMEMAIGDPPSVAGWQPYYQEPGYYQMWINAVTLPYRTQVSDTLSNGVGIIRAGKQIVLDPTVTVAAMPTPDDPDALINELATFVYPVGISAEQHAVLKQFLVPEGLQDYVWSQAWTTFRDDPDNQVNTLIVRSRLNQLFQKLLSMAEYHLL